MPSRGIDERSFFICFSIDFSFFYFSKHFRAHFRALSLPSDIQCRKASKGGFACLRARLQPRRREGSPHSPHASLSSYQTREEMRSKNFIALSPPQSSSSWTERAAAAKSFRSNMGSLDLVMGCSSLPFLKQAINNRVRKFESFHEAALQRDSRPNAPQTN